MFELAGARWPDVEGGPRRLLVVPVGSLEQHGPHLARSGADVSGRLVRDKTGARPGARGKRCARECPERALGCGSAYFRLYFAGHGG